MKDITITKKRQKKELLTLAVCFVVAFCLNIYAIAAYGGNWNELFWSLGFVVTAAVVIYLIWSFVRFIAYLIRSTFNTKTK